MKEHSLLAGLVVSTIALSAANASASNAAQVFGMSSSSAGVTYDNASGAYPVINQILCVGGQTVNGYSYSATAWTELAQDSTGGLELYGALPNGYTPTVGDAIQATGTYSPYHQVPELGTLTSLTLLSQGNVGAPAQLATISQVNVATLPQSVAGQWLQLDDVTISAGAAGDSTITAGETFGTANLTLTITDGSDNSMTFYYNPKNYSLANQDLFGKAILTGQAGDMQGIAALYPTGTVPEFIGMQFTPDPTPTPEPTTWGLCGVGGALTLLLRLRRKA